ncbi:MAG: site-specific integrase [Gammaproteobacteria bacterium]|nr:site-specific integrase [Gammaproteobacteria bacterium]MCP5093437.1 site-specific integrase [Gammaproteobacteria bacterium]
MNTAHRLARFVHSFFSDYLAAQKGLSANTIVSYRDSLKLLLQFVSQQLTQPVDKLTLEHFDATLVVAFLNDLETTRGNTAQTRNNRLAAVRAFFHYVAAQEPTLLQRCQRICDIPLKRTEHKTIEYLEDQELRALLDSVDSTSRNALRDDALLLFLYNTGARVQEVVDLTLDALRLEAPLQVNLIGKGNKERVCPLWPETVAALESYLHHRQVPVSEQAVVFLNAKGEPLTRFGIRYIVRKYTRRATEKCPSLKDKKVSPHSIRHTTAMHLLQSGNDITVVKAWLGHADVNTTHGYVEIDMNMKRKALEACQAPQDKSAKRRAGWPTPSILQWLDELSNRSADYVQSSAEFTFPGA